MNKFNEICFILTITAECLIQNVIYNNFHYLRVGLRPLGCWGRGLESRSVHGCLSLVFICCVVLYK
jgi:hypothetical protein